MDGMLSQEEINALLGNTASSDNNALGDNDIKLTENEKDAVGEVSNISMGTAATTLSTLVNQRVVITTPVVSYATWDDLGDSYDRPCVFIQISYREGLDGNNVLVLREHDVKIITDLMMGGDGSNTSDELSELHLSAISEAMNQMMGSAATSISTLLDKKVDISPPIATLVDLNDSIDTRELLPFLANTFVKVSFKMEIGNLVDSELMQLYPFEFVRDLYEKFTTSNKVEEHIPPSNSANSMQNNQMGHGQTPDMMNGSMNNQMGYGQMPNMMNGGMNNQMGYGQMPNMMNGNMNNQMGYGQMPNMMNGGMNNQMGYGQPSGMQGQMPPYGGYPMTDVNVQPAQFQTFSEAITPMLQQENIDLILDVPLEVTVELGRTNKSIQEILDFSPGTIIELNKIAGEPVDVLVNGKLVAKGEVVVIEENFGIRVKEIKK